MDIKKKIEKVLALSNSPNENEALAALLKAQELMLKYSLTESDIESSEGKKVNEVRTNVWFSGRYLKTTESLAVVIAEHFMCRVYSSRPWGEQLKEIVIVGLDDNPQMAALTFDYAYSFISAEVKKMKSNSHMPAKHFQPYADSYMLGWIKGLEEKLNARKHEVENETGLVAVVPKEVDDYMEAFGKGREMSMKVKPHSYARGFNDGKNFDLSKHIDSNANKIAMKED